MRCCLVQMFINIYITNIKDLINTSLYTCTICHYFENCVVCLKITNTIGDEIVSY